MQRQRKAYEELLDIQDSMVNAKSDTEGPDAAIDLFGKGRSCNLSEACKNSTLSFEELGTSLKIILECKFYL